MYHQRNSVRRRPVLYIDILEDKICGRIIYYLQTPINFHQRQRLLIKNPVAATRFFSGSDEK
jgi:hypothetical protein